MSKETLEILSLLLTSVLIVLGWLYNRRTEEIKIMRNQLSERKHKVYAEIIDSFYSVLKDIKSHKDTNMKNMGFKMLDVKRDIFMYGSDEVFMAFNDWLVNSSTPLQFEMYLKFILSIRKDICGSTKLKEEDVLLNLIQDKGEVEKFKDMMKTNANANKVP